jgi:PAS domain S-box-containing protein
MASAFGLASESDVDGLLNGLREGGEVDPAALRAGCLALVQRLRDEAASRADREHRVKIALEAAQVSFWDLDLRTREVYVDHICFDILGIPRADGMLPIDELEGLTHPDDREPQRQAIMDVIAGKSAMLHFQHRLRHADGRWVWMETFGNVTERDDQGRVVRLTGTKTNITERKQLERALSNTLRVMRALLETMPLPVIMRDTERRVTLVNAAWEKMLGISRHDIVGKQIENYPRKVLSNNHLESDL